MREKKLNKTIESIENYDYLLRKYNFFYTKYNNLPGEYRKLNNEEKNNLYNLLCKNLETIEKLLIEIREQIELLKNKKDSKKVLNKITLYHDFYRKLFNFKLEYGILDYIKEDINNPKELDLQTKYKLQFADIEYLYQELLPQQDDLESVKANEVVDEMYRISSRNSSAAELIKEIDNSIENNDFELINKTLDNQDKLSKDDEVLYLQSVKYDLKRRLRHNDEAIEFYKIKLSKTLKKEINF